MQSTQPRRHNAERTFLALIRAAAAPPPRIPVADAVEIPFETLTPAERNSFFGSFFADTTFEVAP